VTFKARFCPCGWRKEGGKEGGDERKEELAFYILSFLSNAPCDRGADRWAKEEKGKKKEKRREGGEPCGWCCRLHSILHILQEAALEALVLASSGGREGGERGRGRERKIMLLRYFPCSSKRAGASVTRTRSLRRGGEGKRRRGEAEKENASSHALASLSLLEKILACQLLRSQGGERGEKKRKEEKKGGGGGGNRPPCSLILFPILYNSESAWRHVVSVKKWGGRKRKIRESGPSHQKPSSRLASNNLKKKKIEAPAL